MKKTFNMILTTAFVATQLVVHNALANDEASRMQKLKEKVIEKIQTSRIRASGGLTIPLDLDDVLGIRTGVRYQYVLEPDLGKFLRQDKWSDYVSVGLIGSVAAERQIQRQISFGRFLDSWNVALKEFLFSPLDLKGLNSDKIKEKMKPGDMASVTFDKHTFLGLRGSSHSNGVGINGTAGKVFVGKITAKMLRRANNKVTISFANADENAVRLAADVQIEVLPDLLKLKLLQFDGDFRLRGSADLASYTYDLDNPKAKEVLNNILSAFNEPTILKDEDLLRDGAKLSNKLSRGLLDATSSETSSHDITSGIVKEQKVANQIVAGKRTNIRFKLIPNFIQTHESNSQSVNLMDINLSGTFIKPGQYIVGYRTQNQTEKQFGKNSRISSTSAVVYQPNPVLQNATNARGYRGLNDLVGISYHTDADQTSNAKELITYAKLCNAGVLSCTKPIDLSVVPTESSASMEAKGFSSINSNYFFSRGLFEKIKERMNWGNSSRNQKADSIKQAIAPVIREMVLVEPEEEINSMTSFFTDVLENNCFTNLAGIDAQKQTGFKKLFENCGRNVYDIQDDLIRLNMPALLISLFDPTLLPALKNPLARAEPEAIAELAKYFSVTLTNRYKTSEGVENITNGLSFGMSIQEQSTASAQISEFINLINTWQSKQNLDYDHWDRIKMLEQRGS
jgi:hypothetical protein